CKLLTGGSAPASGASPARARSRTAFSPARHSCSWPLVCSRRSGRLVCRKAAEPEGLVAASGRVRCQVRVRNSHRSVTRQTYALRLAVTYRCQARVRKRDALVTRVALSAARAAADARAPRRGILREGDVLSSCRLSVTGDLKRDGHAGDSSFGRPVPEIGPLDSQSVSRCCLDEAVTLLVVEPQHVAVDSTTFDMLRRSSVRRHGITFLKGARADARSSLLTG